MMDVDSIKEMGALLDEISGKIPKMLGGVMDTLYCAESGKKMGQAVGSFYKELIESGIPEAQALQMAKDYMLSIKDFTGSVMKSQENSCN